MREDVGKDAPRADERSTADPSGRLDCCDRLLSSRAENEEAQRGLCRGCFYRCG